MFLCGSETINSFDKMRKHAAPPELCPTFFLFFYEHDSTWGLFDRRELTGNMKSYNPDKHPNHLSNRKDEKAGNRIKKKGRNQPAFPCVIERRQS